MTIDSSAVAALAALAGSLVGGLSSFATTYFTQMYQGRRERVARDLEMRETLYIRFIDQAAALFLDSTDKSLDGPEGLIEIGALMARIRLTSSRPVIDASTAVLSEILLSYERPPIDRRQMVTVTRDSFTNPLAVFTSACRDERAAMTGTL